MNLLEKLKQLDAEATSGPWAVAIESGDAFLTTADYSESVLDTYTDLKFVAEMRNTLPKLLAVVEAAEDVWPYLDEDHALVRALAALEEDV